MSPWTVVAVTVGVLALSAFFVAAEFALVAARQHRLIEAAETSASARAALRSSRELALLLAASQLGITACTLVLGAVTKPAVHHALSPLIETWGLAAGTADVLAFVLALLAVTFVHLVLGEMMPKSWAIAHPEKSATLLAFPIRMFTAFTRPLLIGLNHLANACVRFVGVTPVDQVGTARTADDLRQLVEHSARAGTLDTRRYDQLAVALDLHTRTLGNLLPDDADVAVVAPSATVAQIRQMARDTGHFRFPVRRSDHRDASALAAESGTIVGIVHVRDTLLPPATTTAADLLRPIVALDADTTVSAAIARMRQERAHMIVIERNDDQAGVLTLHNLIGPLLTPTAPTPRPVS